ncbi:MAG: hypothetical protein ABWY64_19950, partial [Tardiphaga sp.]
MGFNFPNSPTEGAVYTAASGQQYTFSNGVWLRTGFAYTPLQTADTYNRVVNGAFLISQQNGNTAVGHSFYPADQWVLITGLTGGLAVRATNNNECYYAQYFTTATTSLPASGYCQTIHNIEGNRTADLYWGTAKAVPVVLRIRAWSDTPGLYVVNIQNADSTRSYCKGISLTTTDQTFVVPIPGCTTGTWPTGTAMWGSVRFHTAVGTDYVGVEGVWQSNNKFGIPGMINHAAQANKYAYIMDVGLYSDPQGTGRAAPWQKPDYASELTACKRYWRTISMRSSSASTYCGLSQPL